MGLTLLLSSPRLPAGVLTRGAWSSLEAATAVYGWPEDAQVVAITDAGIAVAPPPADEPAGLAAALVAATFTGPVVWVGGADGDPGLTDALALEVSRHTEPGRPAPDIELLLGSHDMVGARLLDLVAVMDRLRESCPWDRKQTHVSLVPYLVEETYEAVEAIESGDRAHLVEELGDVLL
ncbi:MAG TPA: MazG nucleotide pyrophosphohydrolase domain-containing protein, partial [Candidatus Lustribacter sp.]|nr:MazG nucleotide pyrophosphohydrolase domain-containing protein [Candidatus Lustribacter sp.]